MYSEDAAIWKFLVMSTWKSYPAMYLEVLRKPLTKSQGGRLSNQDSKDILPESATRALPIKQNAR